MFRSPDVPFYSLVPAFFVSRPNRFVIVARIAGSAFARHPRLGLRSPSGRVDPKVALRSE